MNFTFPATALALTLSLFSIAGHAAPRTVDIDGNGLIEINDLADLNEIRKNPEGKALYGSSQGCPTDGCFGFELKADLDFDTNGDGKIDANDEYWNDGAGWLPIGKSSSGNAFRAIFEGNGHVIRNLYINRPDTRYIGLFGYADNATIRRVGLTGTLTKIKGQRYVGGVLGYGTATHLQGVFASGAVSSAYTSNAYMGGVAGYLELNSTIEDSVSTANVTAKSKEVGGLVGNLYNSTVNRAFSTGRVYSDETSYVGGLIGYESSSTVTQSYWAIDSSGQSSSYGTSSSNSSYFGITLAELGCATSPDDTNCVSGKTLFENWPTDAAANDGIAWVFDGNGLPTLSLNGRQHRDRDGDGYLDQDDQFPDNYAAAIDADNDGHPDRWTLGCDDECVANSGLTLDMFPETAAAWQDDDMDGFPDSWVDDCDEDCQNASDLTLDPDPLDPYNGTPPDGIVIIDADHNGLIDIHTLDDLNAIRYNLEGTGLKLSANDENNSEGCPPRLVNGQMQRLCRGYELKADLDFDTNGDGKIDANDKYWNNGAGWIPIGNYSSAEAFRAIFKGNGHVIRNLYINRPITSYVGLFGHANNATIRRVGLTGTLTQITGRSYVGGVLGYGKATHLQGVFVSGVLSSAYTSNAYMGGVAGYLELNSTIEDSFSTASVTAKSDYVGGLVGHLNSATVSRAFSTGRVYSPSISNDVGGLIGYAYSSVVDRSYWASDSSGQSNSAGLSGSNSSYFETTLAELGCATPTNNSSCVSGKTLFENWPTDAAANNGIAWVFDGNGLPALSLNGKQYRDRDGDGYLDQDDKWPGNYAAAIDADNDGHPDRWTLGCDDECVANSGLTLDMFPETAAAWQDDDMDGFPDSWADDCDEDCQNASDLTLDPDPLDPYNGTPPDGIVIIDADHNGLIDIHTLDDLNAIRYNLEGTGLKLSANDENNSEGCPPRLVNGQMQRLCKGYELKADLDFDTNGDGEIDVKDGDYWNGGEGWLPIGSSSNAFKAVFEGNGHVIRNLYIRRPNAYGVGLFGYTNNATIRRVGLTGTLTQITGRSEIGGILGYGIATHLQGVFASGALSSAYTSNAYMGGVAGYLTSNSTIEDSFSTVSVTAKSSYAGGLVGYLSNSAVNRTFSTGRVYSDLGSNIGGLIGYASSNIITQSYWATDSSGQSRSNGTSNSNPSYFGITLAELGCASASNNTSCVSGKTLFENWPTGAAANDGIAWVFDGNGLPALSLNGKQYRDRDGDGYLDQDDKWPGNYAAAIDADNDGHPDRWTLGCDDECVANSGLTLDMFPETAAAWQDDDMDGFPDSWADDCDEDCQNASDLTLDSDPLDPYNGTPPDGIVIIDADHNGLIDIHTLDDLNAIRYNLEGTGLKLSANDENNSEGCPPRLVNGQMQRLCRGYELKADLDFDTNGDGKIDENDAYWNDEAGWLPIGSSSSGNAFRAIFEGNGHVIRNLYINRPGTSYIGLFGYANNATIRRVGLTGTLTQITGYSNVGGILGYGTATHLQGVFASGALSSANTSTASMGGVAGYLTSNSTLEDSFSIASVTVKGTWIGGLVGYLSSSTVNRAFSIGRVYSDLGSNIGGLIGYASSSPVTQSYWAIDSSGQSSSYGASNSNSSSYFGVTLADLGCATPTNNSSCVLGKTLFENWPTDAAANNGIAWVFDGNGLPALSLNGKQHRDRDGDGYLDQDDQWPDDYAAAVDADGDGHPDRWTLGCDDECVANSGLTLDMFPETAAAWQDDDMDGFPDSWADDCDVSCQNASDLTLDPDPLDPYNGTPPDGIVIVDADHNGLIEIETLEQLDAIRYNLEGTGLKLSANDENNSEGCPPRLVNGQMQRL